MKLVGQHQLSIQPGTPLEKKLAVAPVDREQTSAPMLKVTGSIVARLPPGKEKELAEGRWDFNTPDLSSAYADWIKARADVPFNEKQLLTIRELSAATLKAKKEVADRLEKLVQAGTDPEKDLAAAKADYLQAKIQSQKDEHEAETAVKNAKRTLATLERQLYQAGIDPDLLAKATESTAIVVAEVPEARVALAQPGQACVAQFYAFPDVKFTGRVGSLAPTLSKDRRTLRVFFQVSDPEGTPQAGHVRRDRPGHGRPRDAHDSGRRRAARRPVGLRDRGRRGGRVEDHRDQDRRAIRHAHRGPQGPEAAETA